MSTFKTELKTFLIAHNSHDLNFDSQEFIVCNDCDETFVLPEGTGVVVDEIDETFITLEVPSNIAGGFVRYLITLETGEVEV